MTRPLLLISLAACQPSAPADVTAPEPVATPDAPAVAAHPAAADPSAPQEASTDTTVEAAPATSTAEQATVEQTTAAQTPADPPPQDAAPTTPAASPAVDVGSDQPASDVAADTDGEGSTDEETVEAPPAEQPPPDRARTWTLDPARSFVAVLVRYDRSALMAGHDHAVQATRFTGTVTWDPDDVSACEIEVRVPVQHLHTDPGNSRERMGLEGTTKDKDKASIRKNFLGKSQLWADKHSTIDFRSTKCETRGERVVVSGDLSLRGVTKRVSAPMTIRTTEEAFTARGGFSIRHTDFGFEPFTAVMGALRNEDDLRFTLNFHGRP